jgi:hypothetical protein
MAVNIKEIMHKLYTYFEIYGDDHTWHIDPQTGKVSSTRNVEDLQVIKTLSQLPVTWDKLTHHADFHMTHCESLQTLEGSPTTVEGSYAMVHTRIRDLKGGPTTVGIGMNITQNLQLRSLEGLPTHIGEWLNLTWNPQLPLLRILLVQGLNQGVEIFGDELKPMRQLEKIINKYIGRGYSGMVPCARELIKAGFKGNARL